MAQHQQNDQQEHIAPRALISHASEDKDRFVLDFAARLRGKGVDAWLDKWEMLPGDSLIDKIFEEGLKNADAVIIVLSRYSVSKPWVREELNAAMVAKIGNRCRVIPVVIDNCEMPECLKSTVWEKIENLHDYDDALDRIRRSVFRHYEKPPLGAPPEYATTSVPRVPGLDDTENQVLTTACQMVIESGYFNVYPSDIAEKVAAIGITAALFEDCLDALLEGGYAEGERGSSGRLGLMFITPFGFHSFAERAYPNLDEMIAHVGAELVNSQEQDREVVASATGYLPAIVEHAFNRFEQNGWGTVVRTLGGSPHFLMRDSGLRRWLRNR